jgi:1-acyl-sn-glycerol-3-phosphate acyltransferase
MVGKPKTCLKILAFYSAYALFGGVGVATSVGCGVLSFVFQGPGARAWGQRVISRLFAFFLWYVQWLNLIQVDAEDLKTLGESSGVIFVANHPSLLDVVFVIAKAPRMFCLMKPSLTRNAVFAGQARLAGYVATDHRISLVKACRDNLRAGGNLLVFPEGTRSRSAQLGAFKMGFAMIAKASRAPVQCLMISVADNYLGKGYPFFHVPALPVRCVVRVGERFEVGENEDVRSFGNRVEAYYRRTSGQLKSGTTNV